MELMSSLLLCALAAALPQALGSSGRRQDLKVNSSLLLNQNVTSHKKILLNIMAPPLVNVATELQSVFKAKRCRNCIDCMEKAIKAQKTQEYMMNSKPDLEELFYDVINEQHPMYKRETNNTEPEKKTRTKNVSKGSKSVTITKFSDDNGKVYALKVKEYNSNKNKTDGKNHTCKVYSVLKSLPCDSIGSDAILEVPKKKVKREKKSKQRQWHVTTEKTKLVPTTYRKRDSDNSEMPENYMPSIEDMYQV